MTESQAVRSFGTGSCLAFPPGALFGQRWISIGNDTLVGPHVSISAGMVPGQKHGHLPGRPDRRPMHDRSG